MASSCLLAGRLTTAPTQLLGPPHPAQGPADPSGGRPRVSQVSEGPRVPERSRQSLFCLNLLKVTFSRLFHTLTWTAVVAGMEVVVSMCLWLACIYIFIVPPIRIRQVHSSYPLRKTNLSFPVAEVEVGIRDEVPWFIQRKRVEAMADVT